MSAADFWLAFLVAALIAYGVVYFAARRSAMRPPAYRTADARKMDQQVRQLQAKVPTPAPQTSACTGDCSQGRRCTCRPTSQHKVAATPAAITASLREARQKQADRVKREAVQAALFDIGKRDKTPNRYPPGCRAHVLWALHYDRVTADAAHVKQAARLYRVDKS